MKDYILSNHLTTDLDAAVYTCGYETCEKGHYYGPVMRSGFLIHYVLKGQGIYRVHGITYHLHQGDAFLIIPNTVIYYEADQEDPWTYTWIGMQGLRIEDYLKQSSFYDELVIPIGDNEAIKKAHEQLFEANQLKSHRDLMLNSLLYYYLYLLVEMFPRKHMPESERRRSDFENALRFIEINYSQNISIQSIADELHIERSTLFRLFKEHTGISPRDYLINYRMKRACSLLEETDEPIKVVSLSVGYEDSLYFARLFKKFTNMTATEYRRSKRQRK